MTKKTIRPPVKTHGGKRYLREFIIGNFPEGYPDMTYCEPMCAGASVFLNKDRSKHEVINDIDRGVVCVFKALRDELAEFVGRVGRIRYSEKSFKAALDRSSQPFEDYFEQAVNEYTLRRMSRGGLKKAFAWSDRTRGGRPGDVNAWETMIEELPRISERVKGTVVLNQQYHEIIKAWDEDSTLFYIDPPYLHSTRAEGSAGLYEHEFTVDDHINMLHLAKNVRGKVLISGYDSPLYARTLKDWRCEKKNVANHSSQSKSKERRIECLWTNY